MLFDDKYIYTHILHGLVLLIFEVENTTAKIFQKKKKEAAIWKFH